MLTDEIGVTMKYPNLEMLKNMQNQKVEITVLVLYKIVSRIYLIKTKCMMICLMRICKVLLNR